MRYEAVESSITTTVEALEGGGRRTVYVVFLYLNLPSQLLPCLLVFFGMD